MLRIFRPKVYSECCEVGPSGPDHSCTNIRRDQHVQCGLTPANAWWPLAAEPSPVSIVLDRSKLNSVLDARYRAYRSAEKRARRENVLRHWFSPLGTNACPARMLLHLEIREKKERVQFFRRVWRYPGSEGDAAITSRHCQVKKKCLIQNERALVLPTTK